MPTRRHYVLTIGGWDYHVYGDSLPTGTQQVVDVRLRTTKRASKPLGPNYDGTWNSIQAALLYANARPTATWEVWEHLYKARGTWVHGHVLSDLYGGEARRRVRDLRGALGWPIEERPPLALNGRRKTGVWDYRMPLPPKPRRRFVRVT